MEMNAGNYGLEEWNVPQIGQCLDNKSVTKHFRIISL